MFKELFTEAKKSDKPEYVSDELAEAIELYMKKVQEDSDANSYGKTKYTLKYKKAYAEVFGDDGYVNSFVTIIAGPGGSEGDIRKSDARNKPTGKKYMGNVIKKDYNAKWDY